MRKVSDFLKRNKVVILAAMIIVALAAGIEFWMGRSIFGPDGKFGWWDGNIWSSENSQRFADAYSFSHIIHGIAFYALAWLLLRKLPLRYRFLVAILLEALWEILENSSIIINRYREVTISLGYFGDSILNSMSDILMMALGFILASRARVWVTVFVVIALEVICLFWIRDNLILNIIMLIFPIDAIKVWQSIGQPTI